MMQKVATIGFMAWCWWLALQIGLFITHFPGPEASAFDWIASLSNISMIAGGCVLTWAIARRPRIGLLIVLAILSAFLIWKFYIGEIVFGMHPTLGGHTFTESVSVWLSRHTSSIGRFVVWFPPLVVLAATLLFYPIYTIVFDQGG